MCVWFADWGWGSMKRRCGSEVPVQAVDGNGKPVTVQMNVDVMFQIF
jgi:hypothetical protein